MRGEQRLLWRFLCSKQCLCVTFVDSPSDPRAGFKVSTRIGRFLSCLPVVLITYHALDLESNSSWDEGDDHQSLMMGVSLNRSAGCEYSLANTLKTVDFDDNDVACGKVSACT